MLDYEICKKYAVTISTCLFVCVMFLFVDLAQANARHFQTLKQKLIRDGFNAQKIKKLYDRPQVQFETQGVYLFSKHSEAKLNYNQFTTPKSIQRAKAYLNEHLSELTQAEKRFGVDKTIITAIILVETRFGKYVGNRSVMNILSTMAALEDKQNRNFLWKKVATKKDADIKHFEKWAHRKSRWAYTELKAYLKYTAREKIDPTTLQGSYAGAMGISQFMPSNALRLAQDGNNDGHIDLYNHADAIASIAGFLNHHGWHKAITKKSAYKVLLKYNYSKPYVTTLLKISDLLKG